MNSNIWGWDGYQSYIILYQTNDRSERLYIAVIQMMMHAWN